MLRYTACLLAIICLVGSYIAPAQAEKRVALVIGNSAYEHAAPLRNPGNDANAIAERLSGLGFDVVKGVDLTHRGFAETISQFKSKLSFADVALFFYAGHGLQVHGRNYLAPVDARLEDSTALAFEAVQLRTVVELMEQRQRTNIVFLDACRDNPLARNLARGMGTRSNAVGRGLARMETGVGTLIAFATQPGNVALDGEDKHSPFTKALVNHIATPDLDVALMLRRVRQEVLSDTGGRQIPWQHSSLTGPFLFKAGAPSRESASAVTKRPLTANTGNAANQTRYDPKAVELSFWDSIRGSNNAALFDEYLKRYPDGLFSVIARAKLEELRAPAKEISETKVAALTQQPPEQPGDISDPRELTVALQRELERVGCDPGKIDGSWGRRGRSALTKFNKHAKLNLPTGEPSQDAIEAIKGKPGRVCPLACGAQYRIQGDRCVKKTCRSGQTLSKKGKCIKVTAKKPASPTGKKKNPAPKKDNSDSCGWQSKIGATGGVGATFCN